MRAGVAFHARLTATGAAGLDLTWNRWGGEGPQGGRTGASQTASDVLVERRGRDNTWIKISLASSLFILSLPVS
eukprot:768795-Hanusia_phi.AAC.12